MKERERARQLTPDDFAHTDDTAPDYVEVTTPGESRSHTIAIFDGNPQFRFIAEYVKEGASSGVRITSNRTITDRIVGQRGVYLMSAEHNGTPTDFPYDASEADSSVAPTASFPQWTR